MKIRFLLVSAFAIAMGYGSMTISECGKRYNAYQQALIDIQAECPVAYIELELE